MDGPLGRDGSGAANELVRVESIEQLHHVIEHTIVGHAEVEEIDGMRRAEAGDDLRFALEAPPRAVGYAGILMSAERRANELDRGGSRQHAMPRPPDLAHAAFAQFLDEPVTSHFARCAELAPQPPQKVRRKRRDNRTRSWT